MNSYCAERGSRGVPIGPQKAMGHGLFSFGEELAASPSRRRAQTWRRVPVALLVQRVDHRAVRPRPVWGPRCARLGPIQRHPLSAKKDDGGR